MRETRENTLSDSMNRILTAEKKTGVKYDCSDQMDYCTVQNAMTGVEITESISGMNLSSKKFSLINSLKTVFVGLRSCGSKG